METTPQTRMLAELLAPEDIRPDHYVAVLYVVGEFVPWGALEESQWRAVEPIRVLLTPRYTAHPVQVVEVCLPYVLVRDAEGDCATLDVRRVRLARVSTRFGRRAFELVRERKKQKKKNDSDDDDDDDG